MPQAPRSGCTWGWEREYRCRRDTLGPCLPVLDGLDEAGVEAFGWSSAAPRGRRYHWNVGFVEPSASWRLSRPAGSAAMAAGKHGR